MQEQIPLYAIQPAGPFALQTYNAMLDALESSLDEPRNREQRVSTAGVISGSTRLINGMTVPVVYPDLRGMYKWKSQDLIDAVKAAIGDSAPSDDDILNFLNRVTTNSAISESRRKSGRSISRRQTPTRRKPRSPKPPD